MIFFKFYGVVPPRLALEPAVDFILLLVIWIVDEDVKWKSLVGCSFICVVSLFPYGYHTRGAENPLCPLTEHFAFDVDRCRLSSFF